MPDITTQLTEAESRFFDSHGAEAEPLLSEAGPAGDAAPADNEVETAGAGEAAQEVTPAREAREERLVPLKALQEERAEKKQLREELRAYREWQAQLAQRLQQLEPAQPQAQAPDPKTQPLEYINHVLGNVQNTTAELQQWRQQQEQAAQVRAAEQRLEDWNRAQEQEFAQGQPEYPDAYRFAEEARDRELKAIGYTDPAQRAAIVRMNRLEIMNNALQQNRNPAELVWEYARARGFAPKANRGNSVPSEGQAKIAAGMQVAGAKLNQGGETGEGELTARDLAGITDPEEFSPNCALDPR